jgi:two-component system sensor histidine kinase YesM
VRIDIRASDEFGYLYDTFNNMAASLENLIEISYQQQILAQKAELRQLQSQINPHFLYNSFFTLYRMAKDKDYENITAFLTYLSEYYRYVTRNAQMDVPLEDEVAHAYRYAQIQTMRFGERISISFGELPQKYCGIMTPRLILQPLLENSLNHGLKDVSAGGRLDVSFVEENGRLAISVADNGSGIGEAALAGLRREMDSSGNSNGSRSEVTAIVNIHKRLRLKFGEPYGLRLQNAEAGGLRIEVLIPGDAAPQTVPVRTGRGAAAISQTQTQKGA